MKLKKSGLPLSIKKNMVEFGSGMAEVLPEIRTLEQMKPVLMEKNAQGPKELYFMYRNVCLKEHEKKIFENNLRFDITVIPSAIIGKEFVKTFGHFHPPAPKTKTRFPEVYEVISGTAHYLLQKENDCIVVKAGEGEKVLISPEYGHITINPKKETLVMANWVEKNFKSIYRPIKEKGGGMYFETKDYWVKNKNYKAHPEIRNLQPIEFKEFGLIKKIPMYSLANQIKKLDFLKNPQNYLEQFKRFLQY